MPRLPLSARGFPAAVVAASCTDLPCSQKEDGLHARHLLSDMSCSHSAEPAPCTPSRRHLAQWLSLLGQRERQVFKGQGPTLATQYSGPCLNVLLLSVGATWQCVRGHHSWGPRRCPSVRPGQEQAVCLARPARLGPDPRLQRATRRAPRLHAIRLANHALLHARGQRHVRAGGWQREGLAPPHDTEPRPGAGCRGLCTCTLPSAAAV